MLQNTKSLLLIDGSLEKEFVEVIVVQEQEGIQFYCIFFYLIRLTWIFNHVSTSQLVGYMPYKIIEKEIL